MQSSSSRSLLTLRPTFSNQTAASNYSVSSARVSSKHLQYPSAQLISKSWIKLAVDSVHHDMINDEYQITLSDSLVTSFDFGLKTCSFRLSADKVQLDASTTDPLLESYEDIDKFLEEIDNQTSVIQLDNIRAEWTKLVHTLSLYSLSPTAANSASRSPTTPPDPSSTMFPATNASSVRQQAKSVKPCSFSEEDCPHIQRIIFVLKYYAQYLSIRARHKAFDDGELQKLPSSMTQLISVLANYDKIQLLNDYHHIKVQHSADEFEVSSHIKSKLTPCDDARQCLCCSRNKGNSEIYRHLSNKTRRDLYFIPNEMKDGSLEEIDEINIQQYLDTMHSSIIHQSLSDNLNEKLSTQIVSSTPPFPAHSVSPQPAAFQPFDEEEEDEDEKSTKLSSMHSDSIGHPMTDADSGYDAISIMDSDSDKDDTQFRDISREAYKFGECFTYWSPKMPDFVAAKYDDLKTELTSNTIYSLSLDDYNCVRQQALDYLRTDVGANMHCKRQFSWMFKSIKYGQNITLDHVIVMLLQTNYTQLKEEFVENACRRQTQFESLDALRFRHCEIAHFCRLLKEAIYCFGDHLSERAKLYHGIDCKLMFKSVDFCINVPISTTVKYSIAPHTTNHGICVKFGKPILSNQKNYYLDISNISRFPDEKERVVYGGEPLGFLDIIYNGQSHAEHIMSLRLFQQIVQGNWFTCDKELMKVKYQRRIIKLMHTIMNAADDTHQNYMLGMFKDLATRNLEENTVWINMREIKLCLPEFIKLFFGKFANYLIKGFNVKIKQCDIMEMNLTKQQIDVSSFKKSLYSRLYTYQLSETDKISFIFRFFKKFDEVRKENMFRGFVAIKYLPKANVFQSIEMRYGLHFPQKPKLSKWDTCVLSPSNLYKGSSLFSLSEIKQFDALQIEICFQIRKVT